MIKIYYMKKVRNTIEDLKYKYPNDKDLGSVIRREYRTVNIKINNVIKSLDLNKEYPNDYDLGNFIRNNIIIT